MASMESLDHAQTLFPGYHQVEEFGADADYEDEETAYITLDLGNVEPTLVPSASSYYLIGLDTPTPFLQLQGTVLKGSHHQLLGTEMIFSEDKELHRRTIQHVANTEQRILFKEVTLEPRSPPTSSMNQEVPSESTEPSKTSDGTAQNAILDIDGQRIDRITGKAAPLVRAPRTRGSSKKKAGDLEDSITQSSKEKEKQALDSDLGAPSMDLVPVLEKDTT